MTVCLDMDEKAKKVVLLITNEIVNDPNKDETRELHQRA
jgi:hypothetical protein